eukprot:Gb_35497 [translate_table: standard]
MENSKEERIDLWHTGLAHRRDNEPRELELRHTGHERTGKHRDRGAKKHRIRSKSGSGSEEIRGSHERAGEHKDGRTGAQDREQEREQEYVIQKMKKEIIQKLEQLDAQGWDGTKECYRDETGMGCIEDEMGGRNGMHEHRELDAQGWEIEAHRPRAHRKRHGEGLGA